VPASGHTTRAAFAALSSRRIWSLVEKRAILAEMAMPGAVVMEVARRHGIAQSLLYRWRSDAAKATAAAKAAPRKIVAKARPSPLASIIEIDLGNGRTVRATTDIETSGPGPTMRHGLLACRFVHHFLQARQILDQQLAWAPLKNA